MHKIIVAQFVTLDGVVDDPDGSGGTPHGGWAFRYGPGPVSGDKFLMGSVLETGVKLLGRTTWELRTRIFPTRDDEFSRRLNAMEKLVVSQRPSTSTGGPTRPGSGVTYRDRPGAAARPGRRGHRQR